jgi:hypothetical protein
MRGRGPQDPSVARDAEAGPPRVHSPGDPLRLGPRLLRIAFVLAGLYNLAFGAWAGLFPHRFFALLEIDPPRYPSIWACLGMVVGVYGLLYLYAARHLDRGKPIIAIGLLGKVLGPIGMMVTIGSAGELPQRAAMLCVYNDLIWWLPFALYLLRGTRLGAAVRPLAPWVCAALHALALAGVPLLIQAGSGLEDDWALRSRFILEHTGQWRVGWGLWMASAVSLVGFYAWWGARVAPRRLALAAVLLAAAGMVCDLSGEGLLVFVLPERLGELAAVSGAGWERLDRAATLLTAGAANGLYTLGGVLLTVASAGSRRRGLRALLWMTWASGLLMFVSAVADYRSGLIAASAVLFPCFIVCCLWMGRAGVRRDL